MGCLLLPCLAGCANPGPLEPPSAHLPELARSLTAERSGDTVAVSWLPPRKSSDGAPLRGATEADLCRALSETAPCLPVAHTSLPVAPQGKAIPVSLTDTLPAALLSGPPRVIYYRVDQRNGSGRSAGLSAPVAAPAGAAPPAVAEFSLSGSREGVVLRWAENDDAHATVQVQRMSRPQGNSAVENVTLQPEGADRLGRGGMVDTSAKPGELYTYTASRVATITLHDQTTLSLHSASTAPAQIRLAADYAPQPPSGLLAVAEFAPESGATVAVSLSWTPALAAGLRYNVYRNDGQRWQRLNPKPLTDAAYRDASLPASGSAWLYRITAVDRAGMESLPCAPATVSR